MRGSCLYAAEEHGVCHARPGPHQARAARFVDIPMQGSKPSLRRDARARAADGIIQPARRSVGPARVV
eukprot:88511-Pleurochrysis_carterae.AAC.5